MFDWLSEYARNRECQWKTRVVSPCFDSVDGLTRYVEALGEISLGPAAFRSQIRQAVFHRYRHDVTSHATTHPISKPLATHVARSGGSTSAAIA